MQPRQEIHSDPIFGSVIPCPERSHDRHHPPRHLDDAPVLADLAALPSPKPSAICIRRKTCRPSRRQLCGRSATRDRAGAPGLRDLWLAERRRRGDRPCRRQVPVACRMRRCSRAMANSSGCTCCAGSRTAALASRLLETALDWLERDGPRTLWIGVWSENFGAQRFYARHGFDQVGEYEFLVGKQRDREFIYRRKPATPEYPVTSAVAAPLGSWVTPVRRPMRPGRIREVSSAGPTC